MVSPEFYVNTNILQGLIVFVAEKANSYFWPHSIMADIPLHVNFRVYICGVYYRVVINEVLEIFQSN